MKKVVIIIATAMLIISCKKGNKEAGSVKQEINQENVTKQQVEEIKLPKNIIQLNDEDFIGKGITLTKVQIQNTKLDNYIFKIFFKADDFKGYQNGDYSLFIQNFVHENDIELLDERFKEKGVLSYWVSLDSAKPYKDGYVIFKSFSSKIFSFKKTVIGIMNLKTKTDILRAQYDDTVIVN